MRNRFLSGTGIALAMAVALAPSLSAAQSAPAAAPENAPIPSDGALVQPKAATPIDEQIDTGNLPGVDFDGSDTSDGASGPGGLQNGVGAVGMSVPSQSSTNPVPLDETQGDDAGIPLR